MTPRLSAATPRPIRMVVLIPFCSGAAGSHGPGNARGRVTMRVLGGVGDDVESVIPDSFRAEVVLESSVEEPLRVRIQVLGRQEPVRQPVLGGESVDVVVVDPPLAADEFGEARRRPGLTGFGVNPPAGRIVPGASVVDEGPGAGGGDVVGVGGIDLDVCAPSGRARRAGRRSRGRRTPPIAPSAPCPGRTRDGRRRAGRAHGRCAPVGGGPHRRRGPPFFRRSDAPPPGWSESALASSIIRVAHPHGPNEYFLKSHGSDPLCHHHLHQTRNDSFVGDASHSTSVIVL